MGNSIMHIRKKAKVMKIDGETFRLKTPATASDVTKEYPGFVLLDSDAVRNFGVRAKPLEPNQILKPKKTYFLVELPKLPPETAAEGSRKLPYRRVMSGIHVSAKERLEMLMLSRRTFSDVAIARSSGEDGPEFGSGTETGPMRLKLRLPKAQVTKLVEESRDASEIAERIIGLYVEKSGEIRGDLHRKLGIGEYKANSNSMARAKHVSFALEERKEIEVQ